MNGSTPTLHVVLLHPQIAPNTGNIARMCAITNTRLHLIHPLGFVIEDKHLKRSAMDYWYELDKIEHASWESFCASPERPKRLWLFTTQSKRGFWDVKFEPGDGLLFGNEGTGAPQEVHDWIGPDQSITIPQFNSKLRSLNLSTAAGIATYEALRQLRGS